MEEKVEVSLVAVNRRLRRS